MEWLLGTNAGWGLIGTCIGVVSVIALAISRMGGENHIGGKGLDIRKHPELQQAYEWGRNAAIGTIRAGYVHRGARDPYEQCGNIVGCENYQQCRNHEERNAYAVGYMTVMRKYKADGIVPEVRSAPLNTPYAKDKEYNDYSGGVIETSVNQTYTEQYLAHYAALTSQTTTQYNADAVGIPGEGTPFTVVEEIDDSSAFDVPDTPAEETTHEDAGTLATGLFGHSVNVASRHGR